MAWIISSIFVFCGCLAVKSLGMRGDTSIFLFHSIRSWGIIITWRIGKSESSLKLDFLICFITWSIKIWWDPLQEVLQKSLTFKIKSSEMCLMEGTLSLQLCRIHTNLQILTYFSLDLLKDFFFKFISWFINII